MRTLHDTLINNVSAATAINSDPIDASYLFAGSLIVNTDTASTAPTITLQVSDDPSNQLGGPTNWANLSSISLSGAGNYIIPYTELSYQWLRVSYSLPFLSPTDTITTTADVAGSLRSKAFIMHTQGGGTFGVFFLVNGTGTPPSIGLPMFGCLLASGDSADTVATKLVSTLNGLSGLFASTVNNVMSVQHTGITMAQYVPTIDYNTGFGFANNALTGNVTINFKGLGA